MVAPLRHIPCFIASDLADDDDGLGPLAPSFPALPGGLEPDDADVFLPGAAGFPPGAGGFPGVIPFGLPQAAPVSTGVIPLGPPPAAPLPRVPELDRAIEEARARSNAGAPTPAAAKSLVGPHKVMAGDPRLLTASNGDPVRLQRFRTDSRIVEAGQKYLGTPYVWGGDDKKREGGLDCSGFTYNAMKDAGCKVPLEWFRRPVDPRTNPKGAEGYGMKVTKDPRPGDVVVFGKSHIGIYVGNVNGQPMYMSANHGGPWATRGNSGGARVDVMPVDSHPVKPPVYFRYAP